MLLTPALIALSALLEQAVAVPGAADVEKRAIATGACNRDNLYRSFIDPRFSTSASSFCSTYIQPTIKTAATTMQVSASCATVTASAAKRGLDEKRDLAATTQYPASRLSSACSCILTAKPTPTTVYTTTVTSTTTVTPSSCSVPSPIVKNGNFENGQAPWVVSSVVPPYPEYAQYESFNVSAPGYQSANAYTVTDNAASSYFELDLTQSITLCAGKKYNFAAQFYMTDSRTTPKETYLTFFVDDTRVAASQSSDGKGPPIVWTPLSGSFTAGGTTATLKAQFVATNYLGVTWGIDNVVITPA